MVGQEPEIDESRGDEQAQHFLVLDSFALDYRLSTFFTGTTRMGEWGLP